MTLWAFLVPPFWRNGGTFAPCDLTLRAALAPHLRADEKAHVRSTLRFFLHVNLGHQGGPRCFIGAYPDFFNALWAFFNAQNCLLAFQIQAP